MAFAVLWAGISARMKLRFAMAGIAAVAEEIVGLPSAERSALFAAADATDAPEALMRRAALIRAYINAHLGGIPEERALEAELEASLGLAASVVVTHPAPAKKPAAKKPAAKKATDKKPAAKKATDKKPAAKKATDKKPAVKKAPAEFASGVNVVPADTGKDRGEPAVQSAVAPRPTPTSPIPGPVAPPVHEKTPEDRAREAHENALAQANADTPARKPERIAPRPVVAERRNGVPLEAHQRLREAHVVMTVAVLDGLLREGRCFITDRRFKEGDRITLVNHKLVANYDLVKEVARDNGWSWISIPLARDVLGDWENFFKENSKKKAEIRVAMLRARLETVEDQISPDSGIRGDDLTCAYFWRHLLKVDIVREERGMEQAAAEERRAADKEYIAMVREEERKTRFAKLDAQKKAMMDAARENFKTRKAIKDRHAEIRSRHEGIKAELANLEASVMDATKKNEWRTALKAERDTLGMEFGILTELWKDLPEEERHVAPSFRVTDSAALNAPVFRRTGKTAKKKWKAGAADSNPARKLTPEEREAARKAAADAIKAKKDARRKDAEEARRRRFSDPHFGEAKHGAAPKKGKPDDASSKGKSDRHGAKKGARQH